ncbi:MAG: sigma-54 dependent transcriptional regulator [Planctomycetes bacterium]|nr:sigma-54 dependent transcriptional regulator [Planctomycetota bacterium]
MRILVVQADESRRTDLGMALEKEGHSVSVTGSLSSARASLERFAPNAVLVDPQLPDGDGLEFVREISGLPRMEAVALAPLGKESFDAQRSGAIDVLHEPVSTVALRRALTRVHRTLRLRGEIGELRDELRQLGRFGRLIGGSPAMQQVYDLLSRVAPTEATVLVTGESGTGKELAAMTLHDMSPRAEGPFLAINCGAVASSMIESELFGHEKGSFTGATQRHAGYFERASGGTLLLDEIGEMSPDLQVKLLRVLETGRVLRIGGEKETDVNVRIVAATNREPAEAIAQGKLREDLYYRLRGFHIRMPSLRERGGDVRLLAEHALGQMNCDKEVVKRFVPESLARIESHSWPGNVRELRNVVQAAWILADVDIEPGNLSMIPESAGHPAATAPSPAPAAPASAEPMVPTVAGGAQGIPVAIGMTLAEMERALIMATLRSCRGKRTATARILGIGVKTLYNKLKQWGTLDVPASPPGS